MKILTKLLKRLHIKPDLWTYTTRPICRKCNTCGTIQTLIPVDPEKSNGYLLAWANLQKAKSNEPGTQIESSLVPNHYVESATTQLVKAIDEALKPEEKTMPKPSLKQQITNLLNTNSIENESNTPDYILAEYLTDCLEAYEKATKSREIWHTTHLRTKDEPGTRKPGVPSRQEMYQTLKKRSSELQS